MEAYKKGSGGREKGMIAVQQDNQEKFTLVGASVQSLGA